MAQLVEHWPTVTQASFDAYLAALVALDDDYRPRFEELSALRERRPEVEAALTAAEETLDGANQALEDARTARAAAEEALATAVESGDADAVAAAEQVLADAESAEADAEFVQSEAQETFTLAERELFAIEEALFHGDSLSEGRDMAMLAIDTPGLPADYVHVGYELSSATRTIAESCFSTDLMALGVLEGVDSGGGGAPVDPAHEPAPAPVATPVSARASFTG